MPDMVRAEDLADCLVADVQLVDNDVVSPSFGHQCAVKLDSGQVPHKAFQQRGVQMERVFQALEHSTGAEGGDAECRERDEKEDSDGPRLWLVEELGPREEHPDDAGDGRKRDEAELCGRELLERDVFGGDDGRRDQHCDTCVVDTRESFAQLELRDAVVGVPDDRRHETLDGGKEEAVGHQLVAKAGTGINLGCRIVFEHNVQE
ncbi:hypothetical protein OGATHE_000472 [Ogataea polymorpha]|uniref:Uncharacterized protein n=1 Tax=Ogataea polymorpha TaxID=460523 RepID=A0A9P8PSX8_9ASCO|nr:hypothetical protein OGATHE_000472 [Ogataea polymorpha]